MSLYTLTSDFGTQNYFQAIAKANILAQDTQASILDICHTIEPYKDQQAAYVFKSAFVHFPEKTFHFLLCNMYNVQAAKLLVTKIQNQFIFFIDNGILSLVFPNIAIEAYQLNTDHTFSYTIPNITKAFSQAAAYLKKGIQLHELGKIVTLNKMPKIAECVVNETNLIAQVLYIDNFKNVVINLTQQQFETIKGDRNFTIEFIGNEKIRTISQHYFDVETGRKLCFWNQAGYLEIAVRDGNAADLFGFDSDFANQVDEMYKSVKIFFE